MGERNFPNVAPALWAGGRPQAGGRSSPSCGSTAHKAVATEQGAVLIAVLWVLVALSMLALSFAASIRTEIDAARNVVDQKQSYYLARAGIEYAIYKVVESQNAFVRSQIQSGMIDAIPEVLTGSVELSMPNGIARVEIGDETGKINLNLAPTELIFNLLIVVGVETPEATLITESIEDWRDPDDLERPNGAESSYYLGLEEPYSVKNALFDAPEELLLVRGVTPEIYYGRKGVTEDGQRVEYYGLQKYFTTFTTINRININSAPLPVLAAIPDLNYEDAAAIHEMTRTEPIQNVTEIMQRILGLPTQVTAYLATIRSNTYSVTSDAHLSGSSAISRIRCVVQLNPMSPKGYAVLYWNESNVEL